MEIYETAGRWNKMSSILAEDSFMGKTSSVSSSPAPLSYLLEQERNTGLAKVHLSFSIRSYRKPDQTFGQPNKSTWGLPLFVAFQAWERTALSLSVVKPVLLHLFALKGGNLAPAAGADHAGHSAIHHRSRQRLWRQTQGTVDFWFPAQVALTSSQIWWTTDVGIAFQ